MDYHGTTGNDILDQAKLGIPDGSFIYGDAGDDTITTSGANVDGGPGNDTIISTNRAPSVVYWDSPKGVTVDLQAGQAQDGFGTIDELIGFSSTFGSNYSDRLSGSNGDDRFWCGRGDDFVDGRGGVNSVSFWSEPPSKFSISYDTATKRFTVTNPDPNSSNYGTKTLENVQLLQFSGEGSGDTSILLNPYIPNYTIAFNGKNIPISIAGTWTPVNASDPVTHATIGIANSFYSQVTLANGRNGLVLDGWAYNGWDNKIFYPVNAVLFEQNLDGTLTIATDKYISDPVTNGSGSALVADFNGDGKSDIFLAAHNESPSIPMPSTAYLSNANGTFTRVALTDSVMGHGAVVANFEGLPTVFLGGEGDPYYQYRNGSFVQTLSASGSIGGSSVNCADFDGDGEPELVSSDFSFGPGYRYNVNQAPVIAVYKLADVVANSGAPVALLTPFFNGKLSYANVPNLFGNGTTHEPRLWVDDFNHDGKPDILGSALMWSSDVGNEFAMLQMFQNTSKVGSVSFVDRTDALNFSYNVQTNEVDKSMQIIDIDHSGIAAYFQAGKRGFSNQYPPQSEMQNNYLLLNDGTGKLHTYMHAEFQSLGEQVNVYAAQPSADQPRFIAYLTSDKKINFVAELNVMDSSSGNPVWYEEFVNVPLQLDPTVDYLESITTADRNQSMLMRTWAGNDTFYDTNANSSSTSIDGGLGMDTSSYSHSRQQYQITHKVDGTWGVTQSGSIADTLRNIERLKFSDGYIAMDVGANQSAGATQLLLGAVLGKDLLATKQPLIGAVIDLFDHAYTLQQLSGAVMRLPIWDALTGKAVPTNTDIANYLLWRLNGVTPDVSTLANAVNALDAQPDINQGQGDFLWHLAESAANQAQVGLVGLAATGLAFTV